MVALSDELIEWLRFLIFLVLTLIATVVCNNVFKWNGWCKLPTLYTATERKIMFRPIQTGCRKKIFEFGDAIVVTKPLLTLQHDMIALLNHSKGGMLCICDPQGSGKTSTAIGAALARHDGMPSRVLCILAEDTGSLLQQEDYWYYIVKRFAGIPSHYDGFRGASHLYHAISNTTIFTKRSKRLRSVDNGHEEMHCSAMEYPCNYGVLIIEGFNPFRNLQDGDNKTIQELQGFIDLHAPASGEFMKALAQSSHEGRVVVVITTTCINALRWIHHGINNGGHQKASVAKSFTCHQEPNPRHGFWPTITIPDDYRGMGWDEDSRAELLTKKYRPYSLSPGGQQLMRKTFEDDMTIRDTCAEFYANNHSRCTKVYPGPRDYVRDFVLEPICRLFSCQPVCSFSNESSSQDDNMGWEGNEYHIHNHPTLKNGGINNHPLNDGGSVV